MRRMFALLCLHADSRRGLRLIGPRLPTKPCDLPTPFSALPQCSLLKDYDGPASLYKSASQAGLIWQHLSIPPQMRQAWLNLTSI